MLISLFFFSLGLILTNAAHQSVFDPLKHLGGTTPPHSFDPTSSPLDPGLPQGCQATRIAYLVRHAAIHSNDFEFRSVIGPFVEKLKKSKVDWSSTPNMAFLSKWTNPILSQEQGKLSRTGKLQAMDFGVELAHRYFYLRTPTKIWSASSERTMLSAEFFIKGLAVNSSKTSLVGVFEGEKDGANSLSPYTSCPAYNRSGGAKQSLEFLQIYTQPILQRFNTLAPSFNFTPSDIYAMSLICGYETVLRGSSPFCSLSLLSPNEWLGFEYTNDIRYFYNCGYGAPMSGAIGFPWLNASFNALMSEHDINSDKTVDQDMFISFTHRGLPLMVVVALGLFNNSEYSGADNILSTMPLDSINYQRVWKSSNIIPFMTDIGIEKLTCDSFGYEKGTYYRVIVNGNPHSLADCRDGPAETCKESTMAKWVPERGRIVGDFDTTCKADYSNSTNILSIYS